MCQTIQSILQMGVCGLQMMIRTLMTVLLMIENIVRMILQTVYNFLSIMLQLLSLLPICIVFLLTTKLKCFMCSGGVCPAARSGTCDTVMSFLAFALLFFIFKSSGLLDKIFYNLGYAKAPEMYSSFEPTPGEHTTCSRDTATTTVPPITTTHTMDYYQLLDDAEADALALGWGPAGKPKALENITFVDDDAFYKDAEARQKAMMDALTTIKLPKCKITTTDQYFRKYANRKVDSNINDVDPLEEEENKIKDILRDMQESQSYLAETLSTEVRSDEEVPSSIESPIPTDIGEYIVSNTGGGHIKEDRTKIHLTEGRSSEARPRVLYYKHGQPPIRTRKLTTAVSNYEEQFINTETSRKVDFDYSIKELNPTTTNHSNVVYYLM